MAATVKATSVSRAIGLSVVVQVAGELAQETGRLAAAFKSLGPGQWVVVDAGQGLAAKLLRQGALKSMQAEPFSAPASRDPWKAYGAVSDRLQGARILLIPAASVQYAALCREQVGVLVDADLVYVRPVGRLSPMALLQNRLWGLPDLDFYAPVAVRREAWQGLVNGLNARSLWLGPRFAALALRRGLRVKQVEAPANSGSGILDLLKQALAGGRARGLSAGAAASLVAIITCQWVLPHSSFLGLGLLGASLFVIGAAFGRD